MHVDSLGRVSDGRGHAFGCGVVIKSNSVVQCFLRMAREHKQKYVFWSVMQATGFAHIFSDWLFAHEVGGLEVPFLDTTWV